MRKYKANSRSCIKGRWLINHLKRGSFRAIISLCLLTGILLPQLAAAQKKDSLKIAAVQHMIDSRNYTFKAQTMLPLSGRSRQLTSDYDLQVSPDKVVSSLPYFGRAYSAPIGTDDGGLQFTSKDVVYTSTPKKKGGWNISIKCKDVPDIQQLALSVYDNGTASLQVNSTNRQSISFTGYITAPNKTK